MGRLGSAALSRGSKRRVARVFRRLAIAKGGSPISGVPLSATYEPRAIP